MILSSTSSVSFLYYITILIVTATLIFSSSSSSFILALDDPARQMLRLFQGITNRPPAWNTADLIDWRCSSDNDFNRNNRSCCSFTNGNQYSCDFTGLRGTFSLANGFTDPTFQLHTFTVRHRWNYRSTWITGPFPFSTLPTSTRQLTIEGVSMPSANFDLAQLPRGMTYIHVHGCDLESTLDFTQMPPNLERFDVRDQKLKGNIVASQLPASLRHFTIHSNEFSSTDFRFQDLPTGIETCHIRNNRDITTVIDLSNWPPGIKDVSLGVQEVTGVLRLQDMPPTMQSLYIHQTDLTGSLDLNTLPATLNNLRVTDSKLTGTVDLSRLPNALRELRFQDNDLTGDMDLTGLNINLEILECHSNNFNGTAMFPPSFWGQVSKLERLQCNNNKLQGDIDASLLARNLTYFHWGDNRAKHFTNMDQLPPRLVEFLAPSNPQASGHHDWLTWPRTLERISFSSNGNWTSNNIANFTLAPRGLISVTVGGNKLGGPVDFRDSPKTMEVIGMPSNLLNGTLISIGNLSAEMPRLREVRFSSNNLEGDYSLRSLPPGLTQLTLGNNRKLETNDLNLLYLPTTLNELTLDNTKINNYLVDLNHLPTGMTNLNLQNTGMTAHVRSETFNLPLYYNASWPRIHEFCDRVVTGNTPKSMLMCNITQTRSFSKTFSRTESTSPSLSISDSRSSIDKWRDWMLDVVLYKVTNIPPHWRVVRLDEWMCGAERLCCPRTDGGGMGMMQYSCSFSGLVGRVRVDFPPDYPLRSFSITDSPTIDGSLSLDLMPTSLRALEFSDTANVRLSAKSVSSTNQLSIDSLLQASPQLENLTLCDNRGFDNVVNAINLTTATSSSPLPFRVLKYCGGTLNDTNALGSHDSTSSSQPTFLQLLSQHAPSLIHLDLSRNRLSQPANVSWWSTVPRSLTSLNLAFNQISGQIDTAALPRSLQYFNVSGNRFLTGSPDFTQLPPGLEVFDASANQIGEVNPNFDSLAVGAPALRFFSIRNNLYHGGLHPSSVDVLPPNLERFIVTANRFRGTFEVEPDISVLPNSLLANGGVKRFCNDIIPGNSFRSSFVCGLTMSKSVSKSVNSLSISASESDRNISESLSHSISEYNFTETPESSPSHSESANTKSIPTPTATSSHQQTESLNETTSKEQSQSRSGASHTLSLSSSAELPWEPWRRTPVLTAVLVGGGIAAAFTPTASAAALIVSRQTAVARAFGSEDGTCGGPTRSDPLSFIEDPLQLDFDPEGSNPHVHPSEKQCMGQLGGIFVGNLIVILVSFILTFIGVTVYENIKRRNHLKKRLLRKKEQFERHTGRELDIGMILSRKMPWTSTIFSPHRGLPHDRNNNKKNNDHDADHHHHPSPTTTKTKNTSNSPPSSFLYGLKSGWPLEVISVFGFGFLLPPAASALLVGAVRCSSDWGGTLGALTLILSGIFLYRMLFVRLREEKFLRVKAGLPRKARCWLMLTGINFVFAPSGLWNWLPGGLHSDESKKRAAMVKKSKEQQQQRQETDQNVTAEDSLQPMSNQIPQETKQQQQQEEEVEDPFLMERNRLYFLSVNRWLDKYIKRSWWFLCFELGVRALMVLAPPIAEAVPPQYSCIVMRAIYLLAVNALLIAVLSRRPYVHRALFWATTIATVTEILVLIILIVNESSGTAAAPPLLITAQIVASILAVGVEIYMAVGRRFFPWMLDKRAQKQQEQEEEDDDYIKNDLGDSGEDPLLAELEMLDENKNEVGGENDIGKEEEEEKELEIHHANEADDDDDLSDDDSLDVEYYASLSPHTRAVRLADFAVHDDYYDNDDDDNASASSSKQHRHDGGGGDELDLFEKLDRRMRRAYRDLVHEDEMIVPKNEKYQSARDQFDDLVNL